MRLFKHRIFDQWAESNNITDNSLKKAIEEIQKGLYEANLGGGLYKKRIAMPGQGKRGSYRTILAFKKGDKAFFIYGFAKNDRDNIDQREQRIYRQLAKDLLNMDESAIKKMIKNGKLFEVK